MQIVDRKSAVGEPFTCLFVGSMPLIWECQDIKPFSIWRCVDRRAFLWTMPIDPRPGYRWIEPLFDWIFFLLFFILARKMCDLRPSRDPLFKKAASVWRARTETHVLDSAEEERKWKLYERLIYTHRHYFRTLPPVGSVQLASKLSRTTRMLSINIREPSV